MEWFHHPEGVIDSHPLSTTATRKKLQPIWADGLKITIDKPSQALWINWWEMCRKTPTCFLQWDWQSYHGNPLIFIKLNLFYQYMVQQKSYCVSLFYIVCIPINVTYQWILSTQWFNQSIKISFVINNILFLSARWGENIFIKLNHKLLTFLYI